MPGPLTPEEEASIFGYLEGRPKPPPANAEQKVASYWGAEPPPPVIELDEPLPYQPNPGAPNYQPNPGVTKAVAPPAPPAPVALGHVPEPPVIELDEPTPKPKPMVPSGPTAADDAALEAYNASLTAKPHPTTSAPAGKPNPDPFGIKAANAKILGSFDESKAATANVAHGQAAGAGQIAHLEGVASRRRQEEAQAQVAAEETALKKYDEQIAETQRQLDDVRSKRIRPMRMMEEGNGLGVAAIIGGIFGGIYQGLHGLKSNPFLDDLNRMIDRQMAADEKNIDNQRASLGQKMSLLQQQRAVYQDARVAKLAAKNIYYEAVREEITAQAKAHDAPLIEQRARIALAELDRAQGEVQRQFGKEAQANAYAQASRLAAQAKEARDLRNTIYDKVLHQAVAAGAPIDRAVALAEAEANRQVGANYAPQYVPRRDVPAPGGAADPLSTVPKDQRNEAAKELGDHAKAEKTIQNIAATFKKVKGLGASAGPWDRDRAGLKATIAGVYKNGLGPGMSSDNDFENFIAPNVPAYGDSDATLARKQANIENTIRSKVATPILDIHAKGWRAPSQSEADAAVGAKPMRR